MDLRRWEVSRTQVLRLHPGVHYSNDDQGPGVKLLVTKVHRVLLVMNYVTLSFIKSPLKKEFLRRIRPEIKSN